MKTPYLKTTFKSDEELLAYAETKLGGYNDATLDAWWSDLMNYNTPKANVVACEINRRMFA